MLVVVHLLRGKGLTQVVEQRLVAPAGDGQLFFQAHVDLVRPDAAHFGMGDPGHALQFLAHAAQIDAEEVRGDERGDAALHGLLTDIGQVALHADARNRTVGIGQQALRTLVCTETQADQQQRPEQVPTGALPPG